MKKLAEFVVKKRMFFLVIFIIATLVSAVLLPLVEVNYDNTRYLPDDMETKQAIGVMEDEFGREGTARVMISGVGIVEAQEFKAQMEQIDGVEAVIWLDDVVDVRTPLAFLPSGVVEDYYRDGHALFQVTFTEDDHSLRTGDALEAIQAIAPQSIAVDGPAMNALATRTMTSDEIYMITLMVIPIVLFILIMATNSWFEPVLFLTVIGVSVLINMGTNVFVGQISYITLSSAALLQLAIAMDYSIFLLHRFGEEREKGLPVLEAMTQALRYSFSAIISSSLTTIAGFVALMFMRYRVGFDMGFVMAKGIVLSLISVLLLMPALTILSEKWIVRTQHRCFLPSFRKFAQATIKLRFVIPVLVILVLVPAFLAQSANHFLHGDAATAASEGTRPAIDKAMIEEQFGRFNPVVLLVPRGNITAEIALAQRIERVEQVRSVQSLVTLADPAIPRDVLPQVLRDNFESENYSRMIVALDTESESAPAFAAVDEIRAATDTYYSDYYVLGTSASVGDIKEVSESDFVTVNMISIIAVSMILLFAFRSLILPVLLVFVIQSSIWINMSIPYFLGDSLIFIGYMIVGAVQLGATIDYGILLTSRYLDNRTMMGKKEAAVKAIGDAGNSIVTSAGILCVCGFMLGAISNVMVISTLGLLIGRGALLSGLMVLVFLPQLLVLADSVIKQTTLNHGFVESGTVKGENSNV